MKRTTYFDLSATGVEGDDGEDVRAVGVDCADGVGGVVEPEVSHMVSEGCRFLNLDCHVGLTADHVGVHCRGGFFLNTCLKSCAPASKLMSVTVRLTSGSADLHQNTPHLRLIDRRPGRHRRTRMTIWLVFYAHSSHVDVDLNHRFGLNQSLMTSS